ncbi:hypothetical protein [Hydrogenophaga crocea]|uniref:AP2/ERF domain-containing protein n=1 Tax=Hydrogenophaga crocea TaxID=2716225 RepID=A0A6G8ICM6_9BURK|nr:hypothetical protein [Hydrogenophaga crocea]QIM50786.1 hypothetical protein G9Q37_00890 [Hydrogenophaga crocea]
MASQSINSQNVVNVEYCGWRIKARWFYSFWGASEGWVCYVGEGSAQPKLNIGRFSNSQVAVERGKDYVDRANEKARKAAAK